MTKVTFSDAKIIYERESRPFGKSWENWVVCWWKWCSSQPYETNPASDRDGKFCCNNQTDTNVWFLAGTFGGTAVRRCVIPFGRSIFFPIITNRISYAEHPYLKSGKELHKYAKADLDQASEYWTRLDGLMLPNLELCRVHTHVFSFRLPPAEMRTLNVEDCRAVSDGYWVFLHPLVCGKHIIEFAGEKLKYDQVYLSNFQGKKPRFKVNVKYTVTVN